MLKKLSAILVNFVSLEAHVDFKYKFTAVGNSHLKEILLGMRSLSFSHTQAHTATHMAFPCPATKSN